MYVFNPSTGKAEEVGSLWIWGQFVQQSEFQDTNKLWRNISLMIWTKQSYNTQQAQRREHGSDSVPRLSLGPLLSFNTVPKAGKLRTEPLILSIPCQRLQKPGPDAGQEVNGMMMGRGFIPVSTLSSLNWVGRNYYHIGCWWRVQPVFWRSWSSPVRYCHSISTGTDLHYPIKPAASGWWGSWLRPVHSMGMNESPDTVLRQWSQCHGQKHCFMEKHDHGFSKSISRSFGSMVNRKKKKSKCRSRISV